MFRIKIHKCEWKRVLWNKPILNIHNSAIHKESRDARQRPDREQGWLWLGHGQTGGEGHQDRVLGGWRVELPPEQVFREWWAHEQDETHEQTCGWCSIHHPVEQPVLQSGDIGVLPWRWERVWRGQFPAWSGYRWRADWRHTQSALVGLDQQEEAS